jgi:drug/metabolite transporter (DMT)-like permease
LSGVLWALVAAIGFAFLQVSNRKTNQLLDAYRTAFGLLLAVETMLVVRAIATGRGELLVTAPISAVALFSVATFIHFVGGWTLLALSQQQVGVARTGALVSAAPIVGTLVAAVGLDEPLTIPIVAGVVLAVVGVGQISLSGGVSGGSEWRRPWLGLTVAVIWGVSPWLIRVGLERFQHPVEGLTIGLGFSVVAYASLLTVGRGWRGQVSGRALLWMVAAQWISFDLTTVAIAITVQQLSVIFVIALVPIMFRQPFERMNARFLTGSALVLLGAGLVVLS